MVGFMKLQEQGKISIRYKHGNKGSVSNQVKKWKSLLFEAEHDGISRSGYIDIFDNYKSLENESLTKVDAYFKFNFNPAYIGQKISKELAGKIHPTGFYFPVRMDYKSSKFSELKTGFL